MKYADEFRDPELGKGVLARLHEFVGRTDASRQQPLYVMEIFGGHIH